MMDLIARNREALELRLAGRRARRYFSPALYALEEALSSALHRHVRGAVLDAGCGHQPYRRVIEEHARRYESIDWKKRFDDQTYQGDVQSMPQVESSRYDTVVCSEVLEHLPRPADALREIHRVLKPGGRIIVSVPYLSRLHEEPHDFYRYTRHGLTHLLEAAGFTVLELDRTGSVFSFLGHQASTLLVCSTWHVPLVRWMAFWLNAGLITVPCRAADRVFGSDRIPLGYVAIAEKGE